MQPLRFGIQINKVIILIADVAVLVAHKCLGRPETIKPVEIEVPTQLVENRIVPNIQRNARGLKRFDGLFRTELAFKTNEGGHIKVAHRTLVQRSFRALERAPKEVLVERLDVGVNAKRIAVHADLRKIAVRGRQARGPKQLEPDELVNPRGILLVVV